LETPIGRRLLAGEIHDGNKVMVDWRDGKLTFSTRGAEQSKAVAGKS